MFCLRPFAIDHQAQAQGKLKPDPSWLLVTKTCPLIYLPQSGDDVALLLEGLQETCPDEAQRLMELYGSPVVRVLVESTATVSFRKSVVIAVVAIGMVVVVGVGVVVATMKVVVVSSCLSILLVSLM